MDTITDFLRTTNILHIEAEDKDLVGILSQIPYPMAYVEADSAMYEQMKVKQYLTYFANLFDKKENIGKVMEQMHLHDYQHRKISSCNASIKKRIQIARAILQDVNLYVLHKPLENIDDESRSILLQWMESLADNLSSLITISSSHRDVCLCPGSHYEFRQGTFQSIDHVQDVKETNEVVVINKIPVNTNDQIYLFNPEQIDYLEAVSGKVFVYVDKEQYTCSMKLETLQTKLEKFGFYRCHRSYIVNMQKVTQVIRWSRSSYSLKLAGYDEHLIPLSKAKIQELKEMYEF